MDQPITFFALAIPRSRPGEALDFSGRVWTEQEIEALQVGYVKLELVPSGKGELLVRAPLLFHRISEGEEAVTRMELYNEGSHRVDDIEFTVELPLGWRKAVEPEHVDQIGIAQSKDVVLTLYPPEDVAEGRYDIRVRTTGMSDQQPVTAEDKTITVEVRARSQVLGTAVVLMLLVGVLGGVVVFAVRLSKR
jgi:uncharacterized membrane protein